jgi:hypothetical protein
VVSDLAGLSPSYHLQSQLSSWIDSVQTRGQVGAESSLAAGAVWTDGSANIGCYPPLLMLRVRPAGALAALGAGDALDLAAIAAAGPLAGQPLDASRAAGDRGQPPLRASRLSALSWTTVR